MPDGVLQVVNGDKESVDAILDNETIQAVGFVGSTPIAHYIYTRAADQPANVPSALAGRKTT